MIFKVTILYVFMKAVLSCRVKDNEESLGNMLALWRFLYSGFENIIFECVEEVVLCIELDLI